MNTVTYENRVWTENDQGYYKRNINGKNVTLHTYIWNKHYGEIPEGYVIDHINHNKNTTDIKELRLITKQQNALNRLKSRTSKYKGVTYIEKTNTWLTQLNLRSGFFEFRYTRSFNSEIAAARDYDRVLLNDLPGDVVREHDLPGNVYGRFVPITNFDYIEQPDFHTARLVSVSEPTEEIKKELGVENSEGLIAYVARVSNPKNQGNSKISKLIEYCCKHGHWSILETCNLTVEIFTTKDIAAQILRHNSMRFQEMSYRYTDSNFLPYPYEKPQLRLQDLKNKQKSIVVEDDRFKELNERVKRNMEDTYSLYNELLDEGIAKECARRILPVTYAVKMYMTGNVRDFAFYIKSRNSRDGKAQVEHQHVADSIEQIFKEQFPIVYQALFKNAEE